MSKKLDKHELGRPKGSRLARRARSFKEDILGKIHQMRGASIPGGRAQSPQQTQSQRAKSKSKESCLDLPDGLDGGAPVARTAAAAATAVATSALAARSSPGRGDIQVSQDMRQISNALRYFQDSVEKDTLGMLPGSASIVLEYVLHLISLLKKDLINDQSSVLISTTNQVYQSLSRFVSWADEVMLNRERATMEGVNEVVQSLQDSLKALVEVSQKCSQNKDNKSKHAGAGTPNGICSSKPDNSHRNSLPELPLTPRERQILESTRIPDDGMVLGVPVAGGGKGPLCHSASSDSILSSALRPDFPPPKPPLPLLTPSGKSDGRYPAADGPAPPLPPKKKSGALSSNSNLLDPVLRSPLFGDWQGKGSLSGASSLDSCLHHSADDLLGMGSQGGPPSALWSTAHQVTTLFTSKVSYQSFAHNTCSTSVSSRSDSVDQLLSHSSSSTHVSALQQMDRTLASLSHQSFDLKASSLGDPLAHRFPDDKPALPAKQRSAKVRTPSQYDNVSDAEDTMDSLGGKERHWARSDTLQSEKGSHEPSCPHHSCLPCSPSSNNVVDLEDSRPPPLPPKKKMIMEYIQTFGGYSQPETDFFNSRIQYSCRTTHYKQTHFTSLGSDDFLASPGLLHDFASPLQFELGSPPALPPKKNRSSSLGVQENNMLLPSRQSYTSLGSGGCLDVAQPMKAIEDMLPDENGESMMDQQDVSEHLIFSDNPDDVRGLKGGPVDALIIHATAVRENVDKEYYYQEAFLTTYKSFVSPMALVSKLIYRYNKFIQFSDTRQKYARWAFSLLVRVVDDLGLSDAGEEMVRRLTSFSHQLVERGDLSLARALRAKVVEKWEAHARLRSWGPSPGGLSDLRVTTQPATLLHFKSELLAEQMTLLDAHLFHKIDISEVLIWAKEQNEESSPNLTKFTEHFNKMSYWARSCILKQNDAKERERVVVKFIKIMKHLRKINNFNSYLAILSALDSAPIRRLEWQRNITEGLKEYCALIDSSSSFRAYRQALSETTPPCIPYIGLVLQDLTFVHVGNTDYITDSIVNFSKCWQQFHILEPMRCFKKKPFSFKRNEQIIDFFNNFEDYLSEDAMWEISENIKPRAGQKKKDYS